MSLQFEERSFSGRVFRPRPEIHMDPSAKILIVATPWGARSAARKAIERILEYLALSMGDVEATSPFQRLSSLSPAGNNLRVATLLANDAIFREDNKSEYKAGVEIFACIFDEDECVFLQVGNPHVLLERGGQTLMPLSSQIDLAFDMSEGAQVLPALPAQLIGIDSTANMNINSFRIQKDDRIVLLSHSFLPASIFSLKPGDISVDRLTTALATADADLAFWLGVLTISETSRKANSLSDDANSVESMIRNADQLVSRIVENN